VGDLRRPFPMKAEEVGELLADRVLCELVA
jgi:hypothetical protein